MVLVLFFLHAGEVAAQSFLSGNQRTNGEHTLGALAELQKSVASGVVQVGESREKTFSAIVLSADGYVLAAASEVLHRKPLSVFFKDGTDAPLRQVRHEDKLNLVLLKVEKKGLTPVQWGESVSLKMGQWLFSLTGRGTEARLGVMSARRRAIANSGAVLGVRFGVDDAEEGVIIEEVASDSPAEKAGLLAEDVVMAVNGEKVFRNENVARIISSHRPGDMVKIGYMREGESMDCEVRLASKRHVLMNWLGEDFANHGTSLRTDNFPEVIQHDQPLDPEDIGGAVYNLEGRAVALNIARVDRVTNYALPVESFLPQVTAWAAQDRDELAKKGVKESVKAGAQ